MKRLCWCLFFIIPFAGKSQGNSQASVNLQSPQTTVPDLGEYVWSHTNANKKKDSKPPLSFDALDNWPSLSEYLSVCNNGEYFAYGIQRGSNYGKRLDSIVVQSTDNTWRFAFTSFSPGFFSDDSKLYVFQRSSMICILHNRNGDLETIEDVVSYKTSPDNKKVWLVYLLKNNILYLRNLLSGFEKKIHDVAFYDFDKSGQFLYTISKNDAKELNIYKLYANKEMQFKKVDEYIFHNGGASVLLKKTESLSNGITKSLQYVNLSNGDIQTIWSSSISKYDVNNLCLDKSGKRAAFTDQENSIWYWEEGTKGIAVKVNNETSEIPRNMHITGAPSFVENNSTCIQFPLQFKPDSIVSDKGYAVSIDIWNYKDKVLLPAQIEQSNSQVSYTAIYNTTTGSVYQLEQNGFRLKCINGEYAVITKSGNEIHGDRFWEKNYYLDSNWLVCLRDNSRTQLPITKNIDKFQFSPSGKFLIFNDSRLGFHYFSYNLATDKLINISRGVPDQKLGILNNLSVEKKYAGNPAGVAGWLEDDDLLFVYDNFDIWQLDIRGRKSPINITNGYGEKNDIIFSFLNNSQPSYNWSTTISRGKYSTLILRAFHKRNKFNGFYLKKINAEGDPIKLFMGPYLFSPPSFAYLEMGMVPLKAADNNVWIVQRQSATDAPNYFVTQDFKSFKRLTDIQPQAKYNWVTTELHSFKQLDGTTGYGVLYKPENFDHTKKYPVIITFYGHLSDRLFQYPQPGYLIRPSIWDDPTWMVSHGYMVFMPDIYLKDNQWGSGVMNSMEGAAKYLAGLPYVHKSSIGAAGHSNSGRFGYYLFTHSKLFSAMAIGAGHAGINIIQTAFTKEKSSIGSNWLEWAESGGFGPGLGNLWKNKDVWIDHTGVLQADKAKSPLLCFYNNRDFGNGQFPFEMFTALRRLEKRAWWLQYDNSGHTIGLPNALKDFTIRYTQFFDHYLKGAPAPGWMTQGVPYKLKGIKAKYELDPSGSCALPGKNSCAICEKWTAQYKITPELFTKPMSEWEPDGKKNNTIKQFTKTQTVKK